MIENLFTGKLRIKSTNQILTLKMNAFTILILSLRTLQTIADPTMGHFCVSIFLFVDIFGKYFGCYLRIEVCQTVDFPEKFPESGRHLQVLRTLQAFSWK